MSQETMQWLNTQTLIGYTDKRGTAWHYRASDQGEEPNHYPGAIPFEDIRRRLFAWSAIKGEATATFMSADGVTSVVDDKRFPVGRADTSKIFGYFSDGYQIHQYSDALLDRVEHLLDDPELGASSSGLLKGGGQAWVQVEVADNVVLPEGVEFRPFLLAATSLDGSLATTYKAGSQLVVCDNTMSVALLEKSPQYKVKHSRYSKFKLNDSRDVLNIIFDTADSFSEQVKALTQTDVNDKQWAEFLSAHAPVPEKQGRGRTMAENVRDSLSRLWNHDARVSPWKGTAWGVVQAVNTYAHHEAVVRGAGRAERNMSRAITGKVDELDQGTMATLNKVLANA